MAAPARCTPIGSPRASGIERIIYPIRAGVMSAFGFLVAPAAFEMLRTLAAAARPRWISPR